MRQTRTCRARALPAKCAARGKPSAALLAALLCAAGVAYPSQRAAAAPGDALVIARGPSASEADGLLRVDRATGARALVSDFDDPGQGPVVVLASDVLATAAGRVFVVDAGLDSSPGALLEIARDGTRRVHSDFGDPRQGPVGRPGRLAERLDGTLLVTMRTPDFGGLDVLVAVGRRGRRSLLSDFQDEAQGATLIPSDVIVRRSGAVVVLAHVTGGDSPLVEVAPDGQREVLSQLSDGQRPGVELPVAIAESESGTLLVLEQLGDTPTGSVIEVARDGSRRMLHDLSNPDLGPRAVSAADLALPADGTILVLDASAGTAAPVQPGVERPHAALLVVAEDGTRRRLSDLGDPAQGPLATDVAGLALLPGCAERRGAQRIAGPPLRAAIHAGAAGRSQPGDWCEAPARRASAPVGRLP